MIDGEVQVSRRDPQGRSTSRGKHFQYSGELAQPGAYPSLPLLADDATLNAKIAEQERVLALLFADCGVDDGPDSWRRLAIALARRHVPAFSEPKGRLKWTDVTLGILFVEAARIAKAGHRGPKRAATQLAKQPRWQRFLDGWGTAGPLDRVEALRRQIQVAQKRKFSWIVLKAFMYHHSEGTIDEWERSVDESLAETYTNQE